MKLGKSLSTPDMNKVPDGPVKDYLRKLKTTLENQHRLIHNDLRNQKFGNVQAGNYVEITSTGDIKLYGTANLIFQKASGNGIQVDTTTPTFGWRDLTGTVVEGTGANKPTHSTYRNGIKQFLFGVGDETFINYHIPHDYVAGTDIYLHIHWSHIDAGVSGGTITFDGEITYSKGHQQASGSVFPTSRTTQITPTVEAVPFKHMVSEIQLSATSPSGTQLDSDDIEPDGMVITRIEFSADNMTGANPSIFIHEADIHYQSTNIATKQKTPDFYV